MVIPNDGDGPVKPDKSTDHGKSEGSPKENPHETPDRPDHGDRSADKEKAKEAEREREVKTATDINERTEKENASNKEGIDRSKSEQPSVEGVEHPGTLDKTNRSSLDEHSNFDPAAPAEERSSSSQKDQAQEILDRRLKDAVNFCEKNVDKAASKDALKEFCIDKLGAKNGDRCSYEAKLREGPVVDCKVTVAGKDQTTEYHRGFNEQTGHFESTVSVLDKDGYRSMPAGSEEEKQFTEKMRSLDFQSLNATAPRTISETAKQQVQIGTAGPKPAGPQETKPPAQLPAGPKTPPEQPKEKLPKAPIVDFGEEKDQPEKKKSTPFREPEDKSVPEKRGSTAPEQTPVNFPTPGNPKAPQTVPAGVPATTGPDAGDIALGTAGDIIKGVVKGILKFKVPKNPRDLKQLLAAVNLAMGIGMAIPVTTLGLLEKSPLGRPKSPQELKAFKEQMKQLKELSTFQGLLKTSFKETMRSIQQNKSGPDGKLLDKDSVTIPHKEFETDQNMTGPSPYQNQG